MNIVAPFYKSQKIKEAVFIWLEKSFMRFKILSLFGESNAGGRPRLLPQEQIHWSLSVSTNMISPHLSLKILNNMLYY